MKTRMARPRLLRWLPTVPAARVHHLGAGIAELPPRTGDPDADARILELYTRYRGELH